jgi:predicted DNA-binding transcriptional regulator AlpA
MQRFVDINTLCQRIGGTKQVHKSTIYRMVAKGLLPKPYHPTPGSSRWADNECEAAIARMVKATSE